MADLNDKQRRFVDEYLVDLNATQAATRAGYSEKTARAIGHELLGKPHVAAAIEKAQALTMAKVGLTLERVLEQLAAIGFAKLTDYLSWDEEGKLKLRDSSELTGEQAAAVESIRVTAQGGFTIKLRESTRPLHLLGQHLGAFKERVEVDVHGLDGLLDRLRVAVNGGDFERALDAGDLKAARRALDGLKR